MTLEVLETDLASAQVRGLRGRRKKRHDSFLDDLAARGCQALAYRLTGDHPLDKICVKHLYDNLRVVVAFAGDRRAIILLVADHTERDPGLDVYRALYRLLGLDTPPTEKRTKPPCCSSGDEPMLDGDLIDEIVEVARDLAKGRPRRR